MNLKFPIVVLFCLIFSGCKATFDDISSDNKYTEVINSEFFLNKELLIFGWTFQGGNKNLEGYSIHDYPGIGGNTIITEYVLPKGTKFKVVSVVKCNNCFPLPSYINLVVKILSTDKYNQVEISMSDQLFYQDNTFTKAQNGI